MPEQSQVPGEGIPHGAHVRGGLLQRKRQPAKQVGEVMGYLPVRVTGPFDQKLCRDVRGEHGNVQWLAGPGRVLAGDQYLPGPGRGQKSRH